MEIIAITSTKFKQVAKSNKRENSTKFSAKRFEVGKYKKSPTAYQRNTLHHIREVLRLHKYSRRKEVFDILKKLYNLEPSTMRHRANGGVGSFTWMPRKGCYRIQVGASRIDTRKPCFRYAPCVEIFDTWNS